MKRRFATAYAVFCTLLLVVGCLLTFYFAYQTGIEETVSMLCGLAVSFVFASVAHELGHVAFAKVADMDCVYVKCFCFKISLKKGKKHFSFASPFADDQTQVLPKRGGDMVDRAKKYTVGGLVVSGLLLLAVGTTAILFTAFGNVNYAFCGAVPYTAYLFLLNVAPLEYAGGKTDALVYVGLKKGSDAEKTMVAAMEIHGGLYEGKTYAEIEKSLYFDLPQLCEDEPLYAVIAELRYRYYLEKEEFDLAADQLNRLAQAQAYLASEEVEKVAAELVYMHALNGDLALANESSKLCAEFLKSETLTAKRVLAAVASANGDSESVDALASQAERVKTSEYVVGVRKFEQMLLERIVENAQRA